MKKDKHPVPKSGLDDEVYTSREFDAACLVKDVAALKKEADRVQKDLEDLTPMMTELELKFDDWDEDGGPPEKKDFDDMITLLQRITASFQRYRSKMLEMGVWKA